MCHFFVVQIFHWSEHLLYDDWPKFLSRFELLHEHASLSILHDQENMIFVIEMFVKLNDIGIVQRVMYFQLSGELFNHIVLENGWLEDLFDGIQGPCFFVDSLIDIPELTWTQLSA